MDNPRETPISPRPPLPASQSPSPLAVVIYVTFTFIVAVISFGGAYFIDPREANIVITIMDFAEATYMHVSGEDSGII